MKTSNAEHPTSNIDRRTARCGVGRSMFSRSSLVAPFLLRVCAKSITGQEAHFEQNDPHPDPLPSDGRGNSQTRLSQHPKRLDTPTDGGRFSLSHPMGEGRGEGEIVPKSEVVFARVLSRKDAVGNGERDRPGRSVRRLAEQLVRQIPLTVWSVRASAASPSAGRRRVRSRRPRSPSSTAWFRLSAAEACGEAAKRVVLIFSRL